MAKASKTGQIIFLAVLLAGLAFLVIRMFNTINPPAPKPKTDTVASVPDTAKSTGAAPATAAKPSKGTKNIEQEESVFKDKYLNPNMFRAYKMETAKNPFVQDEAWYADVFSENLLGYPELKDSEFFDSMDAYLPDIGLIYDGDVEWSNAKVTRRQQNKYSLSGRSADNMIETQISLESDIPVQTVLEWSKYGHVPLETLNNPEAAMRYNKYMEESVFDPNDPENFNERGEVPGLGVPSGDFFTSGVSTEQGDTISCSGISMGYGRTAALLNVNGFSTLVTDGSFIPPRFQVLEIKADGVVLVELESGSSTWIPLGMN